MKTTVEIPDSLLQEARDLAAHEKTTVRALIIDGLRRLLLDRRKPNRSFKLRKASFKGQGLQPALRDASWERIRDASYEGRGS